MADLKGAEFNASVNLPAMPETDRAVAETLTVFGAASRYLADFIEWERWKKAQQRMVEAAKILGDQTKPITSPPTKFLLPWAEAASLEDEGSELNALWEKLLAESATGYHSYHTQYVDILKRMGPPEVAVLKQMRSMFGSSTAEEVDMVLRHIENELPAFFEEVLVAQRNRTLSSPPMGANDLWQQIATVWSQQDAAILFLLGGIYRTDRNIRAFNTAFQNEFAPAIGFLEAENLIRVSSVFLGTFNLVDSNGLDQGTFELQFARLTQRGLSFIESCMGKT